MMLKGVLPKDGGWVSRFFPGIWEGWIRWMIVHDLDLVSISM